MLRQGIGFLGLVWTFSLFAADTELLMYRPLTETPHHPPLNVVAKKTGECFSQSSQIKREDAWSCKADGRMLDPCFVLQFGSHRDAYCLESPWSPDAIQLTLNAPVDNSQHKVLDMASTFPWAVELTNGQKCLYLTSNDLHDGLPVHYQCDGNAVLIGHVQRCKSDWKMLQKGPGGIQTVQIAKAWF